MRFCELKYHSHSHPSKALEAKLSLWNFGSRNSELLLPWSRREDRHLVLHFGGRCLSTWLWLSLNYFVDAVLDSIPHGAGASSVWFAWQATIQTIPHLCLRPRPPGYMQQSTADFAHSWLISQLPYRRDGLFKDGVMQFPISLLQIKVRPLTRHSEHSLPKFKSHFPLLQNLPFVCLFVCFIHTPF